MDARRIEGKMGRLATIGAVTFCCLALVLVANINLGSSFYFRFFFLEVKYVKKLF